MRVPPRLPRVGAHVSTAAGLDQVLPRARRIEAEAVQVFPSSPRQWAVPARPEGAVEALGTALAAAGLPLFVHAIYLINLASADPLQQRRSADALGHALTFAAASAAAGVVVHVGSHRGAGFAAAVPRICDTTRAACAAAAQAVGSAPLPPLLLETGAGSRNSVGSSTGELASLLAELPAGSGLCLDTAHLFAAGYPVQTPAGLGSYLEQLDRSVGLGRVGLVHLNDCKSALGSGADRHENLWEGSLGREGLGLWLNEPGLRAAPFVLETPGFDNAGPDRRNVRRAKRLRGATPG